MFLKNIRLVSFKCHEDLFLDFGAGIEGRQSARPVTFLTGNAGTGKTAFLQAIALLTGGSAVLRSVPDLPDNFIAARKRSARIEATVLSRSGEEHMLALDLVRGHSFGQLLTRNRSSIDQVDALLHNPDQQFFIAGYGVGRRPDTAPDRPHPTSGYRAVQSLFGDNGLASIGAKGPGTGVLKKAIDAFLPAEVRIKGRDKKSGQLVFTTPDGVLPLQMLAGGHQQLISWLGNLVYELNARFPEIKNPLARHGLLLISEVDLHLHPAWQRLLPGILKEKLPNFQIVLTTCSPLVAQQAGPGELYALRREEGGKVELLPFQGAPSRLLLHQLLMSPMFGLETDESVEVERAKAAVRAAALSGEPAGRMSSQESTVARSSLEILNNTVNSRSNSSADPEDLLLLQAINASLSAKKGRK